MALLLSFMLVITSVTIATIVVNLLDEVYSLFQ